MSVQLDETKVNTEGNDVNVINQKIKVKVGVGSKIFEILLWATSNNKRRRKTVLRHYFYII